MSDSAAMFVLLPGLFLCFLLFVEIGRRLGARWVDEEETERERVVLNTIETAIYALLGLMIAFTFSGAAERFDARRSLTVQEGNAIGTAYLRLDLLPAAVQPALREKFRRYTTPRRGSRFIRRCRTSRRRTRTRLAPVRCKARSGRRP